MIERGVVREWNGEEGWGVIDAPGAPGGCWTSFSHMDGPKLRILQQGQAVEIEYDDRGQDGYPFRAIHVVPLEE